MDYGIAIVLGLLFIFGAVLLLCVGAYLYHCGTLARQPIPALTWRKAKIDITGGDENEEELLPRTRV